MLDWKFQYYDTTGNNVLTPGEIYLFKSEVHHFFRCSSFMDHIVELMTEDNDFVDSDEWRGFYGGKFT